jgi:hypothetical protein
MPNTPTTTPEGEASRRPILTLRSAVLLLLAIVAGFVAGYLSFIEHRQIADGLLTGFAAAGGALWWFDRFIS